MILGTHVHIDKIILTSSSVYHLIYIFCFIGFMIDFTDFMEFFSLYFDQSHDTKHTLIDGQISLHCHSWMDSTYLFMLQWHDHISQFLNGSQWLYLTITYIWEEEPFNTTMAVRYSRLSLSRNRRDPQKQFEISELRHIRFVVLRKKQFEQPIFTNDYVIWLF